MKQHLAELTVGPVVIPRSPAASANCLNFQKHAGQAALKTAKKSKKMPNMVTFIVFWFLKMTPEFFKNSDQNSVLKGSVRLSIWPF